MKMTWEKFKNYVDKQLKEQSIPQNVELDYIDISSIALIKEEDNGTESEVLAAVHEDAQ